MFIAELYKSRWQIELFFKWIKQHLRITRFSATSEKAVKTQMSCAITTYVLIAIITKELTLDVSLHPCLQILSVSIFGQTRDFNAPCSTPLTPSTACHASQLILFEI